MDKAGVVERHVERAGQHPSCIGDGNGSGTLKPGYGFKGDIDSVWLNLVFGVRHTGQQRRVSLQKLFDVLSVENAATRKFQRRHLSLCTYTLYPAGMQGVKLCHMI